LDGTLILNLNQLDSGTTLTAAYTRQIGKPSLIVVLENGIDLVTFETWLDDNSSAVLNIASLCESQRPGVYAAAYRCLESLFR
jgi:hypothetical protein